jgi:hypothetical protein
MYAAGLYKPPTINQLVFKCLLLDFKPPTINQLVFKCLLLEFKTTNQSIGLQISHFCYLLQ